MLYNEPSELNASVIVPVYNGGEGLARCLMALSRQVTGFAFEVIVVDDASSEDISRQIDSFSAKMTLRCHRLAKNSGPGAARNAGVALAQNNILLFTDADCVPATDWVEKMLRPFADPEVTGVKGVYITHQHDLWARLAQLEFAERYEKLASYAEIDFIDTYSGGYRKSAFLAAGGFNEELRQNEDVDLAFRVKTSGARFIFVPEAAVAHTHREGWLNYAKLKYWRGYWRMRIYRSHLARAGNDTYTPGSLKIQLLLLVALPLVVLSKSARFIWKLCWLASCMPLIRTALPQNPLPAAVMPLFCFIRGVALLTGMANGLQTWMQTEK
ncbi:MAG TPA: glycosyltransferase [Candidatus Rifleibacterium sp.]|nr:glycosyltransferase [Candidatus Rifleibacterium sp.]HPT46049.1 glycosyltransferase [Candidatus Rifleibacterium sp.]